MSKETEEPPRNTLPPLWEVDHGRSYAMRAIKKAHALNKAADDTKRMFDSIALLRKERGIGKGQSIGEMIDKAGVDYVCEATLMRLHKDDAPSVCAWADQFVDGARCAYNAGDEDGEWCPQRLAVLALYAVPATDTTDDAIEKIAEQLHREKSNGTMMLRAWARVLRAAERAWAQK